MTTKLVLLAVCLCCSPLLQSAFATEENGVRESAVKKLLDQRKIADDIAKRVSFVTEGVHISDMIRTRTVYGNILAERTHFEVDQIVNSYLFLGKLMKASKDVIKCMEEKRHQIHDESEKYFMDKFYGPVLEELYAVSQQMLDKMFEWSNVKHEKYYLYQRLNDEAVKKVKESDNPAEIQAALDDVLPRGEAFIKTAKEFAKVTENMEMGIIVFADRFVAEVRKYLSDSVYGVSGIMQNCYLVKSPYYNIRDIFHKLM